MSVGWSTKCVMLLRVYHKDALCSMAVIKIFICSALNLWNIFSSTLIFVSSLKVEYTMDSQKVGGMVVLHCYGKSYGNPYPITFKVGPVRMYTLAPSILTLLEAPAEDFFWNLPEFGRRVRFDALHGCETCPLEAHFQRREQPVVIRSEIRRVRWLGDDRNCCTTSDVWLGALSRCRNHCPCPPRVSPLPPNCIAQPLQNLHVEMTNNTLYNRYELMVHQTIDIK
jgi:hypothetical protein